MSERDEAFTRKANEKVGPYLLMRPLGRGGFSEVWHALGPDGAEVAVKLLIHPEHLAQLRQEASALSLVRGDGIVPILGMGLADDPPWIALALLRGGDLRRRIRGGRRVPATEAIVVFEAILETLARVHKEGIVHGDLKPENVLFTDRDQVQLADFGLSRRITQRSASLSVSLSLDDARLAGTLDYMAPEQRSGEKPTARSDVFAAGVVLYELLTGERPQGVFKMPSEIDASLPPVIDRLIACSLAQDPRHRFASAAPMLAFLRAGLTTDWKDLAAAHKRLENLVRLSAAGQAHGAETTVKAVGIAIATLGIILASAGVLGRGDGLVRYLAGCVAAVAAAAAAARIARPWLSRRYETICELRQKVERQIRTGGEWSRAVTEASRRRVPVRGRRAAPGQDPSAPWDGGAATRPLNDGCAVASGFFTLLIVIALAIRACGTASVRSSWPAPPPYSPPPYSAPPWRMPTFDPPRIDWSGLRDARPLPVQEPPEPFATVVVATWAPATRAGDRPCAVAACGSRVYVASEAGSVWRCDERGATEVVKGRRGLSFLTAGGERFAVAAPAGRVTVHDQDGTVVATLDPSPRHELVKIQRIVLAADGERLAVASHSSVTVFDLPGGAVRRVDLVRDVTALALGPKRIVFVDRWRKVFAADLGRPEEPARWSRSVPEGSDPIVSPDGRWLALRGAEGELAVMGAEGEVVSQPSELRGTPLAVSARPDVLVRDALGQLWLHAPGARTRTRVLGADGARLAAFIDATSFAVVESNGRVSWRRLEPR